MRPFTDPPLGVKIAKMKERVRWQHPWLQEQDIDQTRLVVVDDRPWARSAPGDFPAFSFLVIGDTGWGPQEDFHPQRHIAQQLVPHLEDCRFILHTGDVVYTLGSKEYYPQNFIYPYRECLVGGDRPETIPYDRMVFRVPFFPSLGNHDYYQMSRPVGALVQGCYWLLRQSGLSVRQNIGWHGSDQGDAYARAFLDYLQNQPNLAALQAHIQQHYTSPTDTGSCLTYRPGIFTRVPNRYYTFDMGGVDFFALDSTTLTEWDEEQPDRLPDPEQRQWLRDRLIQSWNNPQRRGRILFFHHPPYVTESTKWRRSETYIVRDCLRWVLDGVAQALGREPGTPGDPPIVDVILTGHAHCLEYLQTGATGHADAHLHWWVCGGSGCSIRRQRSEGSYLPDRPPSRSSPIAQALGESDSPSPQPWVAKSQLFIGKTGKGVTLQQPYSFLRIDVGSGSGRSGLELRVRPFVSQWQAGHWRDQEWDAVTLPQGTPSQEAEVRVSAG